MVTKCSTVSVSTAHNPPAYPPADRNIASYRAYSLGIVACTVVRSPVHDVFGY
jgi:hypothetical protein